jgi:protease IV
MRDSIFYVSMRSFFTALFAIIGLGFGIIPILVLISAIFGTNESEVDSKYSLKIASNAEGVRKSMSKDAPVILKININGIIGGEEVNMKNLRQILVESREETLKNNRVKGILLNLETPGGTVIDSDGIYHALKAYKEKYKVPIYAHVDGLCASGGMYVACAADKIYATDSSIIGSVGVIAPSFLNLSNLLETIGVSSLTLFAGKGKDDLNPLRPWVPGEKDSYQSIINTYYQQFVEIVASNRPLLDKSKLIKEYGANIFPAKEAAEHGYIDESGWSYEESLKSLLKHLSIEDDYYQVIEMENKNWFNTLFNSQSSFLSGKIKHQIQLTPELDIALLNKHLYLYQPGCSN